MAVSTRPEYAELFCLSNYSFLQAASHPEELVERAKDLGYSALGITDECTLSGVVRAHQAAKEHALKLVIGSHFHLHSGPSLILLARDISGYAKLCHLITQARRDAEKGSYQIGRDAFEQGMDGCFAILLFTPDITDDELNWFSRTFAQSWLGISVLRLGDDLKHIKQAHQQAQQHGLRCVALGHVRMHNPSRRVLLDTLSAIRHNTSIAELGAKMSTNGEQHLRRLEDIAKLYPQSWIEESAGIAKLCSFSLDEIRYQYPDNVTPKHLGKTVYLRQLVEQGIKQRWPQGCNDKVRAQIKHELTLIHELEYESYFLTIWDIVRYAREKQILCQGRGSAANSAVCYCLGITEVDPSRMNLLFERFISRERNEPPDIDVDFEHERREEVIQYIYNKYGRNRAALAATIITYRSKSALRDVGKALGFGLEQIEALIASVSGWRRRGEIKADYLREAGFDPDNQQLQRLLHLANAIYGFPRHLSQHVGGFVITKGRLDEVVPIENTAMPDRSVIQWEKDDLEALGLLKIDILSLGMLSAIQRCFGLIDHYKGVYMRLQDIPAEDPAVYAMLQKADTIGVFQIESRAQMSMLPRLRPKNFYELVIEIAIVRPGPIQGDMVHPFLRRKQGLEPVDYPSEEVKGVLERTLGVPIFQEQVIKLAMVAAEFSPGEADQLRRAMAAWKRRGGLEPYRDKLMAGMAKRGYSKDFAERIYHQILGFGDYGFPESHSASFGLLAYASAWLKCYEPAAFCAALINSQPMGFYQPAQLVRDAQNHGVEVRSVDVRFSDWDCTLEEQRPYLRLGMRLIAGLSQEAGQKIMQARSQQAFNSIQDLAERAELSKHDLKSLAAADALGGISGHRHQAAWEVAGIEKKLELMQPQFNEAQAELLPPTQGQNVLSDYAHVGLTLREHPLSLVRTELHQRGFLSAEEVALQPPNKWIRAAGLVLIRQRPGNGKAVFITLEDETGNLNLLVWADLAEKQRKTLLNAQLLGVKAQIQRADGVQHLMVKQLEDHSDLLGNLPFKSRNFH